MPTKAELQQQLADLQAENARLRLTDWERLEAQDWQPLMDDLGEKFRRAESPEERVKCATGALGLAQDKEKGIPVPLPVPAWALDYLYTALHARCALEVGSLDEAFGLPTYTEKKLRKERKDRATQTKLLEEFIPLRAGGKPIPWDELAKKHGVSKRTAQELCKEAWRLLPKKKYTKS